MSYLYTESIEHGQEDYGSIYRVKLYQHVVSVPTHFIVREAQTFSCRIQERLKTDAHAD